tara:strand:+ start:17619 stop:17876 length:258 start_codon:yes stop_codon:yes gene_type:complete
MELIDLVCIKNEGYGDSLTLNKIYYSSEKYSHTEYRGMNSTEFKKLNNPVIFYNVKNNKGHTHVFSLDMFIPLNEYREEVLKDLI